VSSPGAGGAWMTWWLWVFVGLALLALEILTPGGFVALFFGAAAIVVGALGGAGVSTGGWLGFLLFSVLSVASLLLFRGPLLRRMAPQPAGGVRVDSLVGESATCVEDVAPGALGKVELRGTSWTARNDGPATLRRGERTRVVRVEGLTLWIRAEASGGGHS